ncbi:MAG TPA: TM2 domain-containing protein [Candidatus Angelobacter sp.]
MPMVYCTGCGKQIHDSAINCPNCGAVQRTQQLQPMQAAQAVPFSASDKRILPAFLLCFFFGVFGAHRFYVGKIGSGVAQLLTLGGLGIWMLVDLILIICGAFTDSEGRRITLWT